jgi:prepilin-type N-terminal cleavage/methylation domain-containing protein
MNCKKAFSLLELILVIFVSSIVLIYSFTFLQQLHQTQKQTQEIAILKIDMNSTKIFIETNLQNIKNGLTYEGTTLFYNKNILLKDVSSFNRIYSVDTLQIDITLDNKIKQTWKFKL